MNVLVFNDQEDLSIDTTSVESVVKEFLSLENIHTDEVDIYFVSEEEISRIHEEFFEDSSPTDCISFPMDRGEDSSPHRVLGEIFICPKTAIRYLLEKNEELQEQVYLETTLYLIHGLLHLLGYDDMQESDRLKMRAKEKEHLDHLLQKKLLLKKSLEKKGERS